MNFEISHAVDDSDVAFVMRLDRKSTVCSMMSSRSTHYHKVGTNIDAFVNLATLNYLLAGLQLCYVPSHTEPSKWFELLHDLDQERYPEPGAQITLYDLRYILRELVVPFGVVRGSEKQGGQDETGLSPATWPVNFVCNMVLDGHDRNVLNYWHFHDVNAGDDLVFRLKPMPIPKGKNAYTLNHYYKRFCQQNFESYFLSRGDKDSYFFARPYATHVWQLVPDVFSLDCKFENDHLNGAEGVRMSPGFEVPKDYVWQEHGFWHIARSQVMVRKYALQEYYNDDMANQMKTSHLDVTFEPTYTKVPGEERDPANPRCVKKDGRAHRAPDVAPHVAARDARGIRPGMMAPGRGWAPELFLEGASSWRASEEEPQQPPQPAAHDLDLVLFPPRPQQQREAQLAEPLDFSAMFEEPPRLDTLVESPRLHALVESPRLHGLSAAPAEDYSLVFSDPIEEAPRAPPMAAPKPGRKRKPHDDAP